MHERERVSVCVREREILLCVKPHGNMASVFIPVP